MSEAVGWRALRTVCHGCRTMREVIEQVGPHEFTIRAMIIPGEGTIFRRVQAVFDPSDAIVESPCPDCGSSDTPEWLPAFVPPT